jgi:hypothetical protein
VHGPPGFHPCSFTPFISRNTRSSKVWLFSGTRKADPHHPSRSASESQLRAALNKPRPAGKSASAYPIATRKDLKRKRKNHERGWDGGGKAEKGSSRQSIGHDLRWNHQDIRHKYRRQSYSGSLSIRSWSQRDQYVGGWQDTQVCHHEKGLQGLVGGGSSRELGRLC